MFTINICNNIRKVAGGYIVEIGHITQIATSREGPIEVICTTLSGVLVEIIKASGEYSAEDEIKIDISVKKKSSDNLEAVRKINTLQQAELNDKTR